MNEALCFLLINKISSTYLLIVYIVNKWSTTQIVEQTFEKNVEILGWQRAPQRCAVISTQGVCTFTLASSHSELVSLNCPWMCGCMSAPWRTSDLPKAYPGLGSSPSHPAIDDGWMDGFCRFNAGQHHVYRRINIHFCIFYLFSYTLEWPSFISVHFDKCVQYMTKHQSCNTKVGQYLSSHNMTKYWHCLS